MRFGMNNSLSQKSNLILILSVIPLMIFSIPLFILLEVDLMMIAIVAVFFVAVTICLKDITENIFFLCFLASFFIFLVSGDLAEQLFHRYYWLRFSEDATLHSRICILLSVSALLLGYLITRNKRADRLELKEKRFRQNAQYLESLRAFSKIVFYLTFVILMFDTINKAVFVATYGYVEYYVSYDPLLPDAIVKLGDFAKLALVIFLATFPTKKECRIPIALYFVYATSSLFVGQRGGFVYNALFLLVYILYRNKHERGEKPWIRKGTIALIIIAAPFLLIFFQLFGYMRVGAEIKFNSLFDSLIDFFVNIGASSKVIKEGYVFKEQIPKGMFYSFGTTLNYLKYSPLFTWFTGIEAPDTHTVEFALESHQFSSLISYLSIPAQYLKGEGTGSSFIAELFADFGYIGVVVGSFFYGVIIKKISALKKEKWFMSAIKLLIFLALLKAPRGGFDSFLGDILNVKNIIAVATIILVADMLSLYRDLVNNRLMTPSYERRNSSYHGHVKQKNN